MRGSLVAELCAMICLDVSSEINLLLDECDCASLDASVCDLLDASDCDSLDTNDHDSFDGGGGIL